MRNKLSSVMTLAVATIFAISSISCKSSGQSTKHTGPVSSAMVADTLRFKDFKITDLKFSGEPYRLCEQKLTSDEYMSKLQPETPRDYRLDYKFTPDEKAFFFPDKDIKQTAMVKNVQSMFNYVTVGNLVNHAVQLYLRKYNDNSVKSDAEKLKEKRKIIAEDMPNVPADVLERAIPDKRALSSAQLLLDAYRDYDGGLEDENPIWKSVKDYKDNFILFPKLTDYTVVNNSVDFWEWYNKKAYVPEFDVLFKMREQDFSEEEVAHLMRAVEREKDIDRRAILAIELTYHAPSYGLLYLGEIMESGIYTKYLFEVWNVWRAYCQFEYGGCSSFSIIPDNYYSQVKALCINSLLRHIQKDPEGDYSRDLMVAKNLIITECLDRMGSDYGNECISLTYYYPLSFMLQPSALGEDLFVE
ncbi:MAG: hypothetical protein IJG54_02560 [Bacteroidales bacterium]|nr:hypothetical protein [Bacteroidales bacterium]